MNIFSQATDLEELHRVFKNNLEVYDDGLLDTLLATYYSNSLPDDPIWLFVIGQPSSSKSVIMSAFENLDDYYPLGRITPKTLASGFSGYKGIAEDIRGKVVCMNDMGPLLTMNPQAKLEIWGQFRELFDGIVRQKTGNGVEINLTDIFITMIANATPSMDSQRSIFNQLGNREIIYRLKDRDLAENQKIIDKMHLNKITSEEFKLNLSTAVKSFFAQLKPVGIRTPDKETKDFLLKVSWFIANMRATGDYDFYTGEILSDVVREEPIRVFKMLSKLLVSLLALDPEYSMDKAKKILRRIAVSSCQPKRIRILQILNSLNIGNCDIASSEVARMCKMGKKPVLNQLWTLFALGLIEMEEVIEGNYKPEFRWSINDKGRDLYSLLVTGK